MEDEGPDAHDAPGEIVANIQATYESVIATNAGTLEATQTVFSQLVEITNQCCELGIMDPSFSDIFTNFALIAGQLGDAEMCLEGYAQALEFTMAREPFSVFSCIITMRMLRMACLADAKIDNETRNRLESLAREHFRMVYGAQPGIFENMNPELMQQLSELNPDGVQP